VVGQVPVDGSGVSTFTADNLAGGTHDVSAYYQSDTNFASSSNTQEVSITDGTSTGLDVSPNPANFGQEVTMTATVSAADSGAGTPTGSVVFSDGGTTLDTVPVDGNGQAVLKTSTLTFGSHSISASFTGSNGWGNSSVATPVALNIEDDTSTAIGSDLNPSTFGNTVHFTATVTSVHGAGTPTGTVIWKDGANTIGGGASVDGSGQEQFTTSSLAVGSHNITCEFTGTGGWHNSTSTILVQVVNSPNDTTPPSIPQGVGVNPGPGKNKVTVTWTASTDPDDAVDHYEIWRSTKPNGNFTLDGVVSGTSFTDNVGNRQTRYFYVIAVDTHGNRSAASDVASGTSPNIQTGNDNGNGKG
jgi:hypothetical protein